MIRTTIVAAGLALAAILPTAPAQAQRARVFVASYGNDGSPCTFTQPCRTFQQAVNVVANSGEVTAIDSAGFGPISITRGVTITSPNGVEAGIVASGDAAIVIAAQPTDAVILRGLTLQGANSTEFGIVVNSAGKIEIIDCVVRDFSEIGISFQSNISTLVHVSNTKVMNNANTGIIVSSSAGTEVTANFDHLTVIDNNSYGIAVGTSANATIVNSNISNNGLSVGCNIKLEGDASNSAYAVLQYLTLSPHGYQGCSISQQGFSSMIVSQVLGGQWQQTNSDSAGTDGTNIIGLPAHTVTTVRN